MKIQIIAAVLVLSTVSASAQNLTIAMQTENIIDLGYRHSLTGPIYCMGKLAGGSIHDATSWRPCGAEWAPSYRRTEIDGRELRLGAGLGLKWKMLRAEVDITRHWLDGDIQGTSKVLPNDPVTLWSKSLPDTWTCGLTGLAEIPLAKRLALQIGGGYRWDLQDHEYDLSGPFASMGIVIYFR